MISTAQIREPNLNKGRLISFEGLDGAGKTTQIEMLEHWLKSRYISYVRTREPGGTLLGKAVRSIMLHSPPEMTIVPLAETFLFQADRAEHFAEVVIPALEEGKLVITDRCFDASIAYQGYARGVGPKLVEELSLRATQGHMPDLTILLDLNPSEVHRRVGYVEQLSLPDLSDGTHDQIGVREELNRLDTEAESFHRRARDGFRALARANPKRIKVVNASQSPEKIHEQIIDLVEPLLDDDWTPEASNPSTKRSDSRKKATKSKTMTDAANTNEVRKDEFIGGFSPLFDLDGMVST